MKRRTYGMGTLRERSSGSWFLEYKPKWAAKRLSKTVEAASEKAARTKLGDWIKELDAMDKPAIEVSAEDLKKLHLADMRLRDRDPYNISRVEQKWDKHLVTYFAKFDFVKGLKKAHLKVYAGARLKAGAARATINREISFLLRGLRLSVGDELVRVPAPEWDRPPENNIRTGFIEDDMYYAILERLPEHQKMLWCFGLRLGIRRGELLKLKTEWLLPYWNEPEPYIRVPGFVDRKRGLVVVDPAEREAKSENVVSIDKGKRGKKRSRVTKSGGGHTIPLYSQDLREFVAKALQTNDPACPYLFQYRGKPIKNFYTGFRKACADAGHPDVIFHDTRRTAIRFMEDAGIPRRKAMQITGHKTESAYKRYDIGTEAEAVEAGQELRAFAERRAQRRKICK